MQLGVAHSLIQRCLDAAAALSSKLLQNITLNIRKKSYLTRVFVAPLHKVKKRVLHMPR
ncbi:hypothetical protein HMPREF3232_00474 [Fannyhessea vaginae]|nr:hypothetical protein HMPREF3232_00474 [Fannyhessea vaginae]